MKTIWRKLCAILCAAVLVGVLTPTASAATFSDVYNHWAAGYIETCAGRCIVDGVGGGKFDPEGKVTNAQFIKMLCAAFYSAEEQTFENENRAAINTYFNGPIQWYSGKSYYFDKIGLLTNVDYNIQSSASADQPMNRTNMAQVAANVLIQKGIAANEQDMTTAQATMPDYYSVPEVNRTAVKMCYALGIIKGMDGGKFDGASTMTRAQACTVIIRLLDVVGKVSDPIPSEKPTTPTEPTVKNIEVTTNAVSNSNTTYDVTDNGFATGRLNNGKEITGANVKELLAKAKTIWTNGMTWTLNGTKNNNWYQNAGTVINKMLRTTYNLDTTYACGGYAAMISDYLFGKNNNPARQVSLSNVRPGDVIYQPDNGYGNKHVLIVTDTVIENGAVTRVFTTDGNRGNQVHWDENNGNSWDIWNAWAIEDLGTCVAYTRYPD